MPSGRGIVSTRARTGAASTASSAAMAARIRRIDFLGVGLIYTRWQLVNPLISKALALDAPTYVDSGGTSYVEDFDRRGTSADVTYCPNSNFALPEAPPWRFRTGKFAGIRWHSDCSSCSQ